MPFKKDLFAICNLLIIFNLENTICTMFYNNVHIVTVLINKLVVILTSG